MSRNVLPATLLAIALLASAPLAAGVCDRGHQPAATLLLPYFEVELGNRPGLTTLFEINNAADREVLTKVTLWTDLGVPVMSFNVYLAPFDMVPVNLRDVLEGRLPQTEPASFHPPVLPGDIDLSSCAGALPPRLETTSPRLSVPTPPNIVLVWDLWNIFAGMRSPVRLNGGCGGYFHGDPVARGYLTVDTVGTCTSLTIGDPGYAVNGGLGEITNDNVLWGNFYYVEPGGAFGTGMLLVHIQADGTDPETSVPGQYTFYGAFVQWQAADNRRPLASDYAVRHLVGGNSGMVTDFIVWRDPKTVVSAFDCAQEMPAPFPLGLEQLRFFDEGGDALIVDPALEVFPLVAQRVRVEDPGLLGAHNYGWGYFELGHDATQAPPEDPSLAQAWVGVLMETGSGQVAGLPAVPMDGACAP